MPATIALAKAGGTTGEWGAVMREVFGEYRAPTGVAGATAAPRGLAEVAERMRAMAGRAGALLVAKPGLDGHSNGAEQIAVAARDAGMEVIYSGIRLTLEQIVASARDEDPDVIGLSILSGSHLELVPDLIGKLRAEGIDAPGGGRRHHPRGRPPEARSSGRRPVYTPKDFELATIMSRHRRSHRAPPSLVSSTADATGLDAFTGRATELVFGEGADRVCKDIPDSACREQPRNLSVHLASLTATKTGDGLLDPKLVLAWLLTALGAPAAAIGAIVPAREAFALLPQLFIAEPVRRRQRRKWVWAGASIAQGLVVVAIAVVTFTLDGVAAGWAVVALVVLFGAARSAASVSYKDVLGKTVSKTRRGTVTGTATSISAGAVLLFGIGLWADVIPLTTTSIGVVLLVAGGLWLAAGAAFTTLAEDPGSTEGGRNGIGVVLANVATLWHDPQLGRFVATRSLLTVTAVAPPYILSLTRAEDGGLGDLGPFVIASSLATIVGGRLWGRLSDRSSRLVLVGAALASTMLFTAAAAGSGVLDHVWLAGALLFLVVLAYQGVRLGRSTHLVDMADEEERAVYTAVSNTVVGIVIIATGAFGVLSDAIGLSWLFVVFAAMSAVASVVAWGLDEVQ
jgi:methylmalonyl-CoA mutase cobalamin-binding subunit